MFIKKQVLIQIILLVFYVSVFPMQIFALSDAEYLKMKKNSEFKKAADILTKEWKNAERSLSTRDFELLRNEQRNWIKKGRDEEAMRLMEELSMSKIQAYTEVTYSRIEYIQQYVRTKPKGKSEQKSNSGSNVANTTQKRFEKKLSELCALYAPQFTKHEKDWFTKSGKVSSERHIKFTNYPQPLSSNSRKVYAEITYSGSSLRDGKRGYASTLYITDKGIFSKLHGDNDLPDITWNTISSFRFSNEETDKDWVGYVWLGYSLLADALYSPETDQGGFVSYRLDPNDGFFTVSCEECSKILVKFLNEVKHLAEVKTLAESE